MKQRAFTAAILGVAIVVCCLLTVAPAAFAATQSAAPSKIGGQALEIAPPVMNLSGNPGQVIKTQISLRDISSGSLIVSAQINDFTAAGEDGTPKILLDPSAAPTPYSMKNWVSTLPTVNLKPKQIANLPVTISIPANASPGGHYGVVRFTATAPQLDGQGVSLSASLGTLMLLTVNGPSTEKLTVQELSASHGGKKGTLFQATPLNFMIRLKNEGNIHEMPAGELMITDMFGKPVAGLGINQPPHNILPGTIRKFEAPLDKSVIGNKKLFGRYHAALSVTYGKNKQTVSKGMYFWVIPYKLIAIVILLIVAAFFVLRIVIRRYNQSIISRAQGGKPKKPTKTTKPAKRKK